MSATAFRRPSADEQQVLHELVVRRGKLGAEKLPPAWAAVAAQTIERRRRVVSVGHAWLERAQKKNSRASLRTFVTTRRVHGARRTLNLVTTSAPQAWKQS